jgi:hypothetical protein
MATFVIREVTSGHIIGDEVAELDPKDFVVDEVEAVHRLH